METHERDLTRRIAELIKSGGLRKGWIIDYADVMSGESKPQYQTGRGFVPPSLREGLKPQNQRDHGLVTPSKGLGMGPPSLREGLKPQNQKGLGFGPPIQSKPKPQYQAARGYVPPSLRGDGAAAKHSIQ